MDTERGKDENKRRSLPHSRVVSLSRAVSLSLSLSLYLSFSRGAHVHARVPTCVHVHEHACARERASHFSYFSSGCITSQTSVFARGSGDDGCEDSEASGTSGPHQAKALLQANPRRAGPAPRCFDAHVEVHGPHVDPSVEGELQR